MDVSFAIGSQLFVWDKRKASANQKKHGTAIETAAEALLDPLALVEDASTDDEQRQAAIAFTRARRLLLSST